MEIFRYILCFVLFLTGTLAYAIETTSSVTAFTTDSVQILNATFSAQYILLLILFVIGLVFGVLWRRSFKIEDIAWIIVVITLSMGFACVLLRVKLGT
jgi:NADH:ubiquinone oxidoreductase subunit 3 (subunit A)